MVVIPFYFVRLYSKNEHELTAKINENMIVPFIFMLSTNTAIIVSTNITAIMFVIEAVDAELFLYIVLIITFAGVVHKATAMMVLIIKLVFV